jgi:iron complex outermembrane receptor protein
MSVLPQPRILTLAIALACAAVSTAHAQDTDSGRGPQRAQELDAVVVSARRVEESAEKVPIAVSAFDREQLAEIQASTIDGLQGSVPNLNIVQGRGSSSAVNAFIRGIGQPDALQTFDPGVGLYVDDVYYSRIQGALFGLFDVERVEVLRGPQGTLYGKNSTGGAIKLVTRNPGDAGEGAFELTAGDFGRLEARGYVGTPLSETLGFSFAASKSTNDGYVSNAAREDFNDEDTGAMRAKLRYTPNEQLEAVFTVDWTRQKNALTLGRAEAPLIQTDLARGAVVLQPAPTGDWNYRTETSFTNGEGQKLLHRGIAANISYTINDQWLFKSITANRWLDTQAFIDIDASRFELGDVYVGLDQRQLSQEFQLQYNRDNFQAIAGLYYLRETVPSTQFAFADDLLAFAGNRITFTRSINDDLETTSKAAFVQTNWSFAPTWTLGAGLRYTTEEKDYFRTTSTFSSLAALNGTFAFTRKDDWSAATPSISLRKEFSDRLMGYVSANRGFKSGGFNGRANSAAEVSTFDPEYVWTYELGVKAASADRRLLGSATVFRSDYKDFQARVSEITNPNAPIPTFAFPVLNAAELTINGVELEGAMLIGEGTRINGQLGWLDAKYDTFIDPRVTLNPALARLHDFVPFSPEWTARIGITHSIYLENGGMVTLGGDVSYRDDVWLSVDNRDVLKQDAYTLLGAFVTYDAPGGHWQARVGGRNLSDKLYKTDGQEFSSVGNIQTAYYGMPRNIYVALRYNFF